MHRRLFLLQGVLLGLTLSGAGCAPPIIRQGIHRREGELLVGGQAAGVETPVRPGDTVATGAGGRAVLVMGDDAFLLGSDTRVEFHSPSPSSPRSSTGFTLTSGKILSVLGAGSKTLKIPTAIIGIRGTGIFLQVEPEQDYLCLCYGRIEIRMRATPDIGTPLESRNHASRYLKATAPIRKAPMISHTDEELYMLEALVNRRPLLEDSTQGY
ncbi:MAG: FecR domain-containing protein [Magnetococcales bacterium]|nr:FecR domain-containing protein [Magnetococcales bacterium]